MMGLKIAESHKKVQTLRMRLFQSLLVLWGGKRCIALTPTIWEPSTVSKENRYVSNCQYVNVCTRQIGQLGHVELQTPSDTVCLMFNSSSISMACTAGHSRTLPALRRCASTTLIWRPAFAAAITAAAWTWETAFRSLSKSTALVRISKACAFSAL